MCIPSPVKQLHIPDPFFYQFTCQQNVVGKAGLPWFGTIHFVDIGRFIIYIHHFRCRDLHAVSHFILGYARQDLRIVVFLVLLFVRFIDGLDRGFSQIPVQSVGVFDKKDRVALAPALHALVN
ncbi:hypothetical protein D3C87_1286940 [compost metagenome]